ncbi:cache domain-containing protein [Maridesulfovibrio zosterae]|uniref:cache domain-containing protein n=1 Tax=Maridesulfovibrio zosterae TaxID=82171 RepID=UPI000486DC39|nr:cache domain-containing protein [Maridesulfovibrio zosterae]
MKSIVSILSRYLLSLCFSSTLIFGGITIYFVIADYHNDTRAAKEEIMGDVEKSLIHEVSRVQNFIEFSQKNALEHAITNVKKFILESHNLTTTIYNKYKDTLPESELKTLIKDTLRALAHEQNNLYLFIFDKTGISQINTDNPEIEKTNILNLQTPDGRFICKEMISIVELNSEGYINYLWSKPNSAGKFFEKKAYIKLFKPYNWIIGTGAYFENIKKNTQKDVLIRLTKINLDEELHIFAGQYDGLSLIGRTKGKNILNIKNANGVKVINELISVAKSGGGFLTYMTPSAPPNYKTYKKLSYCTAFPEWKWYIGSGINISILEKELKEKEAVLYNTLIIHICSVCILLLIFSIAIIFFSRRFKKMLSDNFDYFDRFFLKGIESPVKIDRSQITFKEFDQMAILANSMSKSRELAKNELLKSEITYREIFNATKDAIAVMDISKRIFTDVNQAFLDFFGLSRTEAIGMSPEAISFNTPPYDNKYAAELFKKAQSGQSVHFEWMVKNSKKEPFWTDNLARVATIGGQKKLLIVMRDITERKKMQKIMIQTEKMMSVGGLAAGMAHEINNPLGVIMQVTQNILRRTSPNLESNRPIAEKCNIDLDNLRNYMDKRGITGYLHGIQEAGVRAASIVKSMLDFSRKSNSSKSSCNIETVIETAISLASNDYDLKKQYDFKKIKIIRDYSSPPMFNFTEMEISQVILNLIKNAAQAISEDENKHKVPTITIRTLTDKQSVKVEIEDNGPGIPEEHLKRIFEPFYSTKSPGQGTGLGLSVSYFIVTQNHSGNITVDSSKGDGTRFTITLPVI